ncbi:RsmE family RNA methyltransferase [bacterium]|nr:MAG: RsmE family RNA methyltransferase [bacterium]
MSIAPAQHFDAFLGSFNQNGKQAGLFAYEGASTLNMKQYAAELRSRDQVLPKDIWIFVGSEGGYSEAEVLRMQNLALHPVTLGPQILRVETACMALVSVLKYEFDLMS